MTKPVKATIKDGIAYISMPRSKWSAPVGVPITARYAQTKGRQPIVKLLSFTEIGVIVQSIDNGRKTNPRSISYESFLSKYAMRYDNKAVITKQLPLPMQAQQLEPEGTTYVTMQQIASSLVLLHNKVDAILKVWS